MADATDAASLTNGYKEARVAIQHQAEVEKGVVASASVLWTNVDAGKQKTAAFAPLIDKRAAALLDEVKAAYQLQTAQRGVPSTEPAMTAEEREAANLVVEQVAGAGGGRGGGGGAPASAATGQAATAGAASAGQGASAAAGQGGRAGGAGAGAGAGGGRGGRGNAGPSLPTEFNAEFNLLLGKHKTALEIRDFLSGEFTPVPLADVMAVLRAREASGAIRLVPKAK
jgi:hypothetical protein